MEALKGGDLRLLSDILAEVGQQLEVNMEYEAENYKTLLQVQFIQYTRGWPAAGGKHGVGGREL